ncbi:hypothetical protein CC80DRAFT_356731, partial [Byssothecium circinans]
MPRHEVDHEFGRFKIWCGNLGAVQSGKSSLDARLRESTVMQNHVLKHLIRLSQTLKNSKEVTSGARLPLEALPKPEPSDGSSTEESDDDEEPRELHLHMITIRGILNDLYMLAFKIRNSSTRPTSMLRIKHFSEIDVDTGVDKFVAFEEYDRRRVEEILLQMRRLDPKGNSEYHSETHLILNENNYLVDRLVATINKRRKILRYWQRHAQKLAEMPKETQKVVVQRQQQSQLELRAELPERERKIERSGTKSELIAPSSAGKTFLSTTEATLFDRNLHDITETQSIISYASTAVNIHGGGVDLPPPPAAASKGPEFSCLYCGIVCASRQGKGRRWKAHILHDLQPYICTYENCNDGNRLYPSRTAWLEHEHLTHRQIWQCFEHSGLQFSSKAALSSHLQSDHVSGITNSQIQNLVEFSELSVEDTRTVCPFCLVEGPFQKGFENHMAYHMENFSMISVSRNSAMYDEENSETNENQSGQAQRCSSRESLFS